MSDHDKIYSTKLQDKIVVGAVVALKSKIEKIREQGQNIE